MEKEKKVLRFDVELSQEDWDKFEKVCDSCYRSRKNFAEALIMLLVKTEGTSIDLTKLGVIK